jgi:hypothetical protein
MGLWALLLVSRLGDRREQGGELTLEAGRVLFFVCILFWILGWLVLCKLVLEAVGIATKRGVCATV